MILEVYSLFDAGFALDSLSIAGGDTNSLWTAADLSLYGCEDEGLRRKHSY